MNIIQEALYPMMVCSSEVRKSGQSNYYIHVFDTPELMEISWKNAWNSDDCDLFFEIHNKKIIDVRMDEVHLFVLSSNLERMRGMIISGYRLNCENINNSLSSDMITMETLASTKIHK